MSARDDQDNKSRGSDSVVSRRRLRRRGSLKGLHMPLHEGDINPTGVSQDSASDGSSIVVQRPPRRRARMPGQRMQDEDRHKRQTDSEDSDIASLAGSGHRQRTAPLAVEDDDQNPYVKSDGPSTKSNTKDANTPKNWRPKKDPPQVFVPWHVQHEDRVQLQRELARTKLGTSQASVRDDGSSWSNPRNPSLDHNHEQQLPDEMEIDTISSLPGLSVETSGTAPSRPELTLPPHPASSSLSAAPASSLTRHKAGRSSTSARHSSGDSLARAAASTTDTDPRAQTMKIAKTASSPDSRKSRGETSTESVEERKSRRERMLRRRRLRAMTKRDEENDLSITSPTVSSANDFPTLPPHTQVSTPSGSESDVPLRQTREQRRNTLARAMNANQPGSEPYSGPGEYAPPSTTSYVAAARIEKLEKELASLRQMIDRDREKTVTVAGSTRVSGDASEQARNEQRLKSIEDDLVRAFEENDSTAPMSVASPKEGETHNRLFQAGENDPCSSRPRSAAQSREVIVIDDLDELPSAAPRTHVGEASAGQSTVYPDLEHIHGLIGPAVQTHDTLSTSTISIPPSDTRVPTPNSSHGLVLSDGMPDENRFTLGFSRAPQSSFEVPAATLQMPQPQIPFGRQYAHPNQPEQPRMSHAAQQTSNASTGTTARPQAIRNLPQVSTEQPYSMMSQANQGYGPSSAPGGSPTYVQNYIFVNPGPVASGGYAASQQVIQAQQQQGYNLLNSTPGLQSLTGARRNHNVIANAPAQLSNPQAQRPGTASNSVAGPSTWLSQASPVPNNATWWGAYSAGPRPAQRATQVPSVASSNGRGPGSTIGFTGPPSFLPTAENPGLFVATTDRGALIRRPTLPSANQTHQGSQGSMWGQPPPSQNTQPPGSGPGYSPPW